VPAVFPVGSTAGDARAWLLQIVAQYCYTWLEKNRPVEAHERIRPKNCTNNLASLPKPWHRRRQRERLTRALELFPRGSAGSRLREFEGFSYKEIASITPFQSARHVGAGPGSPAAPARAHALLPRRPPVSCDSTAHRRSGYLDANWTPRAPRNSNAISRIAVSVLSRWERSEALRSSLHAQRSLRNRSCFPRQKVRADLDAATVSPRSAVPAWRWLARPLR